MVEQDLHTFALYIDLFFDFYDILQGVILMSVPLFSGTYHGCFTIPY